MPRRPHSRTQLPSDPMVDHHSSGAVQPGDTLCGYRVVRKLGDATRAEVYLGFSESSLDDSQPTTAAIKVYRDSASAASIATELEALDRSAHPHVMRLTDVATTPSGAPCVVLERLSRGSLAHLLEIRQHLDAGEAVTVLAPLAVALDALHASGVVHGGIGARSILFRESGAPVFSRFGRASLIDPGLPPAELALEPGVLRDRADLIEAARLVMGRSGAVVDWPDVAADGFGEVLAARLFALAEPAPVRFAAVDPRGSAVPARVGGRAAVATPSELMGGVLGPARAAVARVAAVARTVRTPVWVAAASVIVALVAAIALVPDGGSESAAVPAPTGSAPAAPVVVDDDPVAAVAQLLAAREQCFAAISVLCLDSVDQQGSAAFETDAELITAIQNGGEIPDATVIDSSAIALVERLGDSALLTLSADSEPASVLVVKGEAGWRIRDYLKGQ